MTPACTCRAIKWGAPEELWRITTKSTPIASTLRTVSRSVSPLATLLPVAVRLTESAESRFSASSKESRVRVDGSKKRLATVRPRSVGTLRIGRSITARIERAVSRMSMISVAERVSSSRRSFRSSLIIFGLHDLHAIGAVLLLHVHRDHLAPAGGHVLSDVVGPDRQLAMSPVDQDGELDRPRPPEIDQLVERGPHGSPGVEHVIDKDDVAVLDVDRDLGGADHRSVTDRLKVVTIESDVEHPERDLDPFEFADLLLDPPRQWNPPPPDPHQDQVTRATVALDDLVRDAGQHSTHRLTVQYDCLFSKSFLTHDLPPEPHVASNTGHKKSPLT